MAINIGLEIGEKSSEESSRVDNQCKYIYTRGVRKNKRCINKAVKHGYCQSCLKKESVKDKLFELNK